MGPFSALPFPKIALGVLLAGSLCLLLQPLRGETELPPPVPPASAAAKENSAGDSELQIQQETRKVPGSEVEAPASDQIIIAGDFSQEWANDDYHIALIRGRCSIRQGETTMTAQKAVIWKSRAETDINDLVVYLEDQVKFEQPGQSRNAGSLLVRLVTTSDVRLRVSRRLKDTPAPGDAVYRRGWNRMQGVQQAAHTELPLNLPDPSVMDSPEFPAGPNPGTSGIPGPMIQSPEVRTFEANPLPGNLRRIRIFPRSRVPYNVLSFESTNTTPPEQVIAITGGVNLLIDGLDVKEINRLGLKELGTIDLSADRVVIWTQALNSNELQSETVMPRDAPFQVYLEGNIVLRQGKNVVRASRAVYDDREQRALLLDAELKAFVPQAGGNLRIRAESIRQLNTSTFHAKNGFITTSSFGKPGYKLQASDIFLDERPRNPWLGMRGPRVNPETGRVEEDTVPWVTSHNNTFVLEGIPLVSVPRISGPAEDPNIPLRSARVGNDSIFGFQVKTVWDIEQLLGADFDSGTELDLLLDYLSDRGAAIGTRGKYEGANLFNMGDTYQGQFQFQFQHDEGNDNLGLGRRNLPTESNARGRLFGRHRSELPDDMTLIGELGWLSDRNYLEQYFENEFDEGKDNESLLFLKQDREEATWSILGRMQLNDFSNTTNWLPKADITNLSTSLFDGHLNWSSHSSAGYGQLRPADAPFNPGTDLFNPLPFVAEREGGVLMTRHQLDAPFHLGPVKVVPYLMGEAAYWEQGLNGNEVDRLVGRAGVRASLSFSRIFPYVQSRIFNLNGLAHKGTLSLDYSFTESTEDLANIAQYNEFDDNSQERFRERFLTNTFNNILPNPFEPRGYAVRAGAGSSVSDPYHELIDDLQVVRMNLRQRLQTKVGPPGHERTKDWMVLDLHASFFPDANEDNFGDDFGLIGGSYRWNVGDRTSLLASALYDPFEGGQQLWNLGVLSQRSQRGSLYLGVRQVKGGPLDSQILTASYSYAMSEKWVSTFGTAFDLAEGQNRGQSFTLTRVGSDFLVHIGAAYDGSKNNAGIGISIEPRFGPRSGSLLSSLLGIQ